MKTWFYRLLSISFHLSRRYSSTILSFLSLCPFFMSFFLSHKHFYFLITRWWERSCQSRQQLQKNRRTTGIYLVLTCRKNDFLKLLDWLLIQVSFETLFCLLNVTQTSFSFFLKHALLLYYSELEIIFLPTLFSWTCVIIIVKLQWALKLFFFFLFLKLDNDECVNSVIFILYYYRDTL